MEKTSTTIYQDLKQKTESKTLRIGIIGLGYVGLPLATEFGRAGIRATGFDISKDVVKLVNQGKSHIGDIPDGVVSELTKADLLDATTDFTRLREMDAISICVPTPLRKTKDPDMSFIIEAVKNIRENLRTGQAIILESTTYPGTTEELVLTELEKSGLKAGVDFFLAFSPERVDPGNQTYLTKNKPKVLGGVTPECTEIGKLIYETAIDTIITVSSPRAAEMVKLLENTFRSVNIGMANEMAIMCDKLDVNVWEVIDAAATKPFGFMPFYPGPGLGGHCIPIDPFYLSWKLKSLDYDARFITLAGEINGMMPNFVIQRINAGLNDHKKSINGSKVLVLGASYKPNINDVRESPSLDIMAMLLEKGAELSYCDEYVPSIRLGKHEFESVELDEVTLKNADCVVIVTNHSYFDIETVVKHSKLVVDTRNATAGFTENNIVRL